MSPRPERAMPYELLAQREAGQLKISKREYRNWFKAHNRLWKEFSEQTRYKAPHETDVAELAKTFHSESEYPDSLVDWTEAENDIARMIAVDVAWLGEYYAGKTGWLRDHIDEV